MSDLIDDVTIEHLLSVRHGGTNCLPNLALAHFGCNQAVGCVPVAQKVMLRDLIRQVAATIGAQFDIRQFMNGVPQ